MNSLYFQFIVCYLDDFSTCDITNELHRILIGSFSLRTTGRNVKYKQQRREDFHEIRLPTLTRGLLLLLLFWIKLLFFSGFIRIS